MMDISDLTRGPVGADEDEPKVTTDTSATQVAEEKKCWPANGGGDGFAGNLKRPPDEDLVNSKKRRKQLKPIRIATNLEDMVKVPKQIIGLNNDLDNVDDLSHTVPNEPDSNSSFTYDVHLVASPTGVRPERSPGCRKPNLVVPGKPEINDINVPNMGPNYVANPHFLFPLAFQPVKSPGFWSEASLKIFNQEAYCELCKKEFCNKYFLKTHKANKHGIYANASPFSGSKPPPVRSSDGKDLARVSENGRTTAADADHVAGYCDLCNKKFCNKYFARRHMHKCHGLSVDEEPAGCYHHHQHHDADAKIVQNSSNDSTKEIDHLIINRRERLPKMADQDNQTEESGDEEEQAQEVEEGPLNLIVSSKESEDDESDRGGPPEEDEDDDGDECSSENIEKLQTMLLRLNPSDVESKICKVCNETCEGEHRCVQDKREEFLSEEGNDSSNESKTDFEMPRLPDNHEYGYLKQMKPTSSYCEICNKELCNKYFMRTHMQRMHGIEIEHGTQIGGVVCNICNKELCSKYFLRVHKQNTHGITSPNTLIGPSTSSASVSGTRTGNESKGTRSDLPKFPSNFTQVCYICRKRFRSSKWLQAHFVSEHKEEASKLVAESLEGEAKDPETGPKPARYNSKDPGDGPEPETTPESLDVISKIFWEKTAASKTYNCSQCPFTTSVLAFLFVHERSHFVLGQDHPETVKPSASLQKLIHDKTFWQHKITHQVPECLDLSGSKPKYVALEQNGS